MSDEGRHGNGVEDLILYDSADIYTLQQDNEAGKGAGVAVLAASPAEPLVAFSPAGSTAVYLVNADARTRELPHEKVFNPEYEPHLRLDERDEIMQLVWAKDGSKLACLTRHSHLFVISRDARLVSHCDRKVWKGGLVLDLAVRQAHFSALVLTSKRQIFQAATTTSAVAPLLDVHAEHATATALLILEEQQECLTIGTNSRTEGAICVKAWSLKSDAVPGPIWQIGDPEAAPFLPWWYASKPAWRASLSPDSDTLAAVSAAGVALVFNLQGMRSSGPPSVLLLEQEADTARWWSNEILLLERMGVVTACKASDGQSVNLFTPSLPPFLPGVAVDSHAGEGTEKSRAFILHRTESEAPNNSTDKGRKTMAAKKVAWKLSMIVQSSALSKRKQLLLAEQWDAALLLSTSHNLDTDEVTRAQWSRQDVNAQSIKQYWAAINDRRWAVEDCLDRTASSLSGQKQLLQAGLLETEKQLKAPHDSDAGMEWMVLRVRLLSHFERLHLLTQTLHRSYNPVAFREIAELSLAQIAVQFASKGDTAVVQQLLQTYPYSLTSRALDILMEMPETLPSKELSGLFTVILGMTEPPPANKADFIECQETVRDLEKEGLYALSTATEGLAVHSMKWHPPSNLSVSRWFIQRAFRVDAVTGSLKMTQSVLKAGLKLLGKDNQVLREAAKDLDEFKSVISCGSQSVWALRFKDYSSGDLTERLRLLVKTSSIQSIQDDRACLSLVLSKRSKEEQSSHLADFLAREANSKLGWCCELLTQEAEHGLQVMQSWEILSKAALGLMYGCESLTEWEALQDCGLRVLAAIQQSNVELQPSQLECLQQAEQHAKGGQQLSELGMALSMKQIRDCSPEQAREMLQLCLARLTRSNPPESRWNAIWRQLKDVQETAWPFLTKQEIMCALCKTLLACGQWKLARNYLTGTGSTPVPTHIAEQIVINTARNYFFSASSLSGPEFDQSLKCLGVLPGSQALELEKQRIHAILKLKDLGVHILPAQFEQVEDRMDLIQAVLDSKPGIYKDETALKNLASLLGEADKLSKLRLKTAYAALREGDDQFARQACLELVHSGVKEAWPLASQLSSMKASMADSPEVTKVLLGFALAHCPSEQLGSHMDLWRSGPWSRPSPNSNAKDRVLHDYAAAKFGCFDDSASALSCILQGIDSHKVLAECVQRCVTDGLAPRRIMLLGMVTSAFKAGLGSHRFRGADVATIAAQAEQYLRLPPWSLHATISSLEQGLESPEVKPHVVCMEDWAQQLRNESDERSLTLLMANENQGNANGVRSREESLLQVSSEAGRQGLQGQETMRQVFALAERYSINPWPLRSACLHHLLLQSTDSASNKLSFAQRILLPGQAPPEDVCKNLETRVLCQLTERQEDFAVCLRILSRLNVNDVSKQQTLDSMAAILEELSKSMPGVPALTIVGELLPAILDQQILANHPVLNEADTQVEMCRHTNLTAVDQLCHVQAEIDALSKQLGTKNVWPSASQIRMLTFCQELRKAGRTQLPAVYGSAANLLVHMETPHVIESIRFVSLGGSTPNKSIRQMPKSVDRAVRLQVIQDGVGLLSGRGLSNDSVISQLSHIEQILETVLLVAPQAELSMAEQDKLEKELTASQDHVQVVSHLLLAGISFAKVEQICTAMLTSSLEGHAAAADPSAVLSSAVDSALSDALRKNDEDAARDLGGLVTSLERVDSSAGNDARATVWSQLQTHVLEGGPHASAAVQALNSIASENSARWPGWKPDAGSNLTSQAGHFSSTVWIQTLGITQQSWREVSIQPEDVGSVESATQTFGRLLAQTDQPEQLLILAHLLAETWQNGLVFPDAKDVKRLRKRRRISAAVTNVQPAASIQLLRETGHPEQSQQPASSSDVRGQAQIDVGKETGVVDEPDAEGWHDEDLDLDLPSDSHHGQHGDPDESSHQLGEAPLDHPRGEQEDKAESRASGDLEEAGEGWDIDEDIGLDLTGSSSPQQEQEGQSQLHPPDNIIPSAGPSQPSERSDPGHPSSTDEAQGPGLADAQIPKDGLSRLGQSLDSQPPLQEQEDDSALEYESELVSLMHSSWAALFQAQLSLRMLEGVLRTIDTSTQPLMTSEEDQNLIDQTLATDEGTALTLLLLPDLDLEFGKDRLDRAMHSKLASTDLTPELLLLVVARDALVHSLQSGAFRQWRTAFLSVGRETWKEDPASEKTGWMQILLPLAAAQLVLHNHQEVSAGLIAEHVRLHPALFTRENSATLLLKFLKSYLRRAPSLERLILDAAQDPGTLLPCALRGVWAVHTLSLRKAIACLEKKAQT